MSFRKTPLAWKNLTHDWRRLFVAVMGVCFAVLLMFVQRGFRNALFDSQVKLIDDMELAEADLFLVSRARYALPIQKRFNRERLYQVAGVPGVKAVWPVYVEIGIGLLREVGRSDHLIRVIGVPLESTLLNSPDIQRYAKYELRQPFSAILDVKSKTKKFPFPLHDHLLLRQAEAELSGQSVRLVGTFSMGTDFSTDGNLLMSDENFGRFFPSRGAGRDPLSVVDLGVVDLEEGIDASKVAKQLTEILPRDVSVLTRGDFRQREIGFWDDNTPIGIIFFSGTVLGFVVGTIICYQIIYTDIADHMQEFATLKAMGYTNTYFIRLIVTQSFYLSLLGFIPGALFSWGIYEVMGRYTGLLMTMTPWSRIGLILVLTTAMCVSSGLLAIRKLAAADPADLF